MLFRKKANLGQVGQSLLELIVVLGVAVIVISALTYATIISLRNAQFASNQAQATKLAQEALERARSARDRDLNINYSPNVDSWNGVVAPHTKPIWNHSFYNDLCNTAAGPGGSTTSCFFKFLDSQGDLAYVGAFAIDDPRVLDSLENVYGNGTLKRGLIIQDDSLNYQTQKRVTSVVYWTDATGTHRSNLTTVLSKLF